MCSLIDVIAPIALDVFLDDVWERSSLYIEGQPGKFKSLFSWHALNIVLATHRLPSSRMRLFKHCVQIPPHRYLQPGSGIAHGENLSNELMAGATLALDHVEEMSFALRDLIADIERIATTAVHANVYAAWRLDCGFGLHYDVQDTMILQVEGRKHWSVWQPTFLHPVAAEDPRAEPPTAEPSWSGVLTDGSLLFLPAGWWHAAKPINVPSLHLTITIPRRTAIDLMRWVVDQMSCHELGRRSLPYAATPEEQQRYLEALQALVSQIWSGNLLQRYRDHEISGYVPPPIFNLPTLERDRPS
jgi:ribosomal protein L16 Arg81 hydroxylase